MSSQPIAPVSFDALSKQPRPYEQPDAEYFNAGLDNTEISRLTTPYEARGQMAGLVVAAIGLTPLAATMIYVFYRLLLGSSGGISPREVLELPDFLTIPALAGLGVFILGGLSAYHAGAAYRRRFKDWQQSVNEAWLAAEGRVVRINHIPVSAKDEAVDMIYKLDEVRRQLKHFDPRGDELDAARTAVHRFIQASDIPLLLKQAAAAPHIKDRAVRQAAKDYKAAVARQDEARQAADDAVKACFALLDTRRQARTDAELIRRANARKVTHAS